MKPTGVRNRVQICGEDVQLAQLEYQLEYLEPEIATLGDAYGFIYEDRWQWSKIFIILHSVFRHK